MIKEIQEELKSSKRSSLKLLNSSLDNMESSITNKESQEKNPHMKLEDILE